MADDIVPFLFTAVERATERQGRAERCTAALKALLDREGCTLMTIEEKRIVNGQAIYNVVVRVEAVT